MTEPVSLALAFKLPPKDALAYFRAKGYQITGDWWEMWQSAHAQAFTIAHCASLDILADLRATFDQGLAKGLTTRQIVADLAPTLKAKGWWGRLPLLDDAGAPVLAPDGTPRTYQAGSPWRIKNAWQVNKRVALEVGRWKAQVEDPSRPYLEYVAVMDSRVRPSHAALNGRIYPITDPIWRTHYPPNGWGCRCRVRAHSQAALERRGLKAQDSTGELQTIEQDVGLDKITGEIITAPGKLWTHPVTGQQLAPDPGWSYNPGAAGYQALKEKLAKDAAALATQASGQAKAALLDLAKADGAEALARSLANAQAKAAASASAAKAATADAAQAAAAQAAKALAQAHGPAALERATAKAAATAADAAAKNKLAAALKTPFGKSAYAGLVGTPEWAAATTTAARLDLVEQAATAAKTKAVAKAGLTNYEKFAIAGKAPTAAQKAALATLTADEQAAWLAQLDAKLQAQAAANTAAAQTYAPPAGPAPLRWADLEQIGPQTGSNPGGLYRDRTTGQTWYVKVPADADRAANEMLTAELYRAAGIAAPEYAALDITGTLAGRSYTGARGIASKIIDGLAQDRAGLQAGTVAGVAEGFVADAWLANWDVVGAGFDNLLVKAGAAVRVDTGGGLLYRAQGAPKGAAFGPWVTEIDTLRAATLNPQAASVFRHVSAADLERGAARVLAIPDAEIRRLVNAHGPGNAAAREALADTLIARKADLAARFPGAVPQSAATGTATEITAAELRQIEAARINGYSRPSDGDQIEDQNLLLWLERTAAGADQARAYLKVRGAARELIEREITQAGGEPLDDGGTYDRILEAVKGIAYHHAQGAPLRAVDLARAREAIRLYAAQGQALQAADAAAARAYAAHFQPWIKTLEAAIAPGEGQPAAWMPPGTLARWTAPVRPAQSGARTWTRKSGDFERAEVRGGRATKTGEIAYSAGYKWETTLPDGTTINYWPDRDDTLFALRRRVEVTAPGKDPTATLRALDQLGIDIRRAAPLDREELYLRRIAYARRDGFREFEAAAAGHTDQAARVAWMRTELSRQIGRDITRTPGYDPQGAHQAFGGGRVHQYRPDLDGTPEWATFQRGYRLHHQITQGDLASSLEAIINGGGQMAPATDKLRRGIPMGGMSPTADLGTGGASYFFTRIKTAKAAASARGLAWRARQVARLDAISYDGDMYGRVTGDFVLANRKTGPDQWRAAAKARNNETILKDGLSLFDDLDAIIAGTPQERADILAMLRRHGYTAWPDGRALDDIVKVAQ